jgi:hypothetical protein
VALAILGVTAAAVCFGWAQNTFHLAGGTISVPKVLWLNFALIVFYIVPFWLWRDDSVDPRLRSLFGWALASFTVRAPIELYIIYRTRLWRCEYGIAHDLFTLLLVSWLALRRSGAGKRAIGGAASRFIPLLQITIVVEMFMAWRFRQVASPAAGTYFAAPTPEFNFVNRASWIAVSVLYPALAWLLWKSKQHETV